MSIVLTFPIPLVEGCVPSLWKSDRSQRRPSDLGFAPSAALPRPSWSACGVLMERMMGARANQQMHVAMGERFARCGRGSVPSSFGSMMGAMGMMGGYGAGGSTTGSGGMMGGASTSSQNGDGDDDFGTAGWVMVAMMALLLVIAGVAVWLLRPSRRSSSAAPLDVLQARYARGEIDAEEYELRRRALGGMT